MVGGVAAVLRGVPLNTLDVDVVHSTAMDNIERLLAALDELEAYYRFQPERQLRPGASHLSSAGHQLLMTKFGAFDLLGQIGCDRSYHDLLAHSSEMELGGGVRFRVLDLETLVAIKEEVHAEKDVAVLPLMRRALEESRKVPKSDLE